MRFNLTLTFFALNNADRSSVYKSLVAFEPTSKEKKNLLKQFVYRVRQFHFSKWHWKEETPPPPPPTPLNDAISPFSRKYLKAPKKNDSLETTLDEGRGGGSVGWRRIMMYGTGLKIRVLTLRCLNNSFVCDWLKCTTQRSSARLRKHSTGKSAGRSGNLRGWTKSFLVFFVFRSWPLRNMFL